MADSRCDCSDNGKNRGIGQVNQQFGLLSETTSPLQREYKKHELKSYLSLGRISFIPFMDNGDATNRVMIELSEVSPTQAACKNLYQSYMQADETITLEKNTGFLGVKDVEVSDADKLEYSNEMLNAFGEQGIERLKNSIKREIENYLVYGNNICEIILIGSGTEKMGQTISYDFNYFRYELPQNNSADWGKYGYLCEDFANVNYNSEVTYKRYSMYPNFTEHEDGTLRCLLHTFKPTAGREWYGIPFHFASIYAQFLEFQMGKYTSLALENKFLSPIIGEREEREQDIKSDEELEKTLSEENQKIRGLYAMGGDTTDLSKKAPIIMLTRPHGATATTFKDIPNNLDADFYGLVFNQTTEQIMLSWRVHSGLFQQSGNALSGGGLFSEVANEFYWTQIKSAQEKSMQGINKAIKEVFKWVGYANNSQLSIALPMPYFIDKLSQPKEQPLQTPTT